jgi:hypothetical protein
MGPSEKRFFTSLSSLIQRPSPFLDPKRDTAHPGGEIRPWPGILAFQVAASACRPAFNFSVKMKNYEIKWFVLFRYTA